MTIGEVARVWRWFVMDRYAECYRDHHHSDHYYCSLHVHRLYLCRRHHHHHRPLAPRDRVPFIPNSKEMGKSIGEGSYQGMSFLLFKSVWLGITIDILSLLLCPGGWVEDWNKE